MHVSWNVCALNCFFQTIFLKLGFFVGRHNVSVQLLRLPVGFCYSNQPLLLVRRYARQDSLHVLSRTDVSTPMLPL